MFSGLTKKVILFLSIVSAGTLLLVGWPTQSDFRAYLIAQQSRELTKTTLPVCQDRRGVCKEIWFSNSDTERLQYRIESASSSLNMQPQSHKVAIVEHLHTMRCWMQDKVVGGVHTMQQTRYFTASEGVYHFLSQSLLADQATLSLYQLPGEDLPKSGQLPTTLPFLTGNAEQIKMHISGKTPLFQASNFKASLNPATEDTN